MTTRTRFAPSPTGRLHLGNARAALVNWLFARKTGGRFMLRLDDTDRERSREEYAAAIEADLRWLGLEWDDFARQSDRFGRYHAVTERLKREGRLYPCFETAEELDLKRKLAQARGRPWVYDRAALALAPAEIARRIEAGEHPHWRFKLAHSPVVWDDLIRGRVEFHGGHITDPVLVRADGVPLYTLSSVVDDIDFGITHIIRGEDHVANTAVQIQLFEAVAREEGGGKPPEFAHFPLIAAASGAMLSKREGSLSLQELREEGLEPMAVNSLLARLGTSDPVEARRHLPDLVADFDLGKFGRAQPRLDPAELHALNVRLLHQTPFAEIAGRLPPGADAGFWDAVRPNLETIRDAAYWWEVCRGRIEPVQEDPAFLAEAAALLPAEPFDAATWPVWTGLVKEKTGRKGKALFHPLRLALTARENGPELKALLPLIGRKRALERLLGESG